MLLCDNTVPEAGRYGWSVRMLVGMQRNFLRVDEDNVIGQNLTSL